MTEQVAGRKINHLYCGGTLGEKSPAFSNNEFSKEIQLSLGSSLRSIDQRLSKNHELLKLSIFESIFFKLKFLR